MTKAFSVWKSLNTAQIWNDRISSLRMKWNDVLANSDRIEMIAKQEISVEQIHAASKRQTKSASHDIEW